MDSVPGVRRCAGARVSVRVVAMMTTFGVIGALIVIAMHVYVIHRVWGRRIAWLWIATFVVALGVARVMKADERPALTVRELIAALQQLPPDSEVYLDELVDGDGERPVTDVLEDDYCGGDVARVILTNVTYAGQPKHKGGAPSEEEPNEDGR